MRIIGKQEHSNRNRKNGKPWKPIIACLSVALCVGAGSVCALGNAVSSQKQTIDTEFAALYDANGNIRGGVTASDIDDIASVKYSVFDKGLREHIDEKEKSARTDLRTRAASARKQDDVSLDQAYGIEESIDNIGFRGGANVSAFELGKASQDVSKLPDGIEKAGHVKVLNDAVDEYFDANHEAWQSNGTTQQDIDSGKVVKWNDDAPYYCGICTSEFGSVIGLARTGDVISIDGRNVMIDGSVSGDVEKDDITSVRQRAEEKGASRDAVMFQTSRYDNPNKAIIKYGHFIA